MNLSFDFNESAGPKPRRKRKGFGKCNSIDLKLHAVICIIANIILAFAFLVLIIVWVVVRAPLTMPKESLTCIPCDLMKTNAITNPGPEPAGRSAIKQRDDGMCCGPVERITQMLFQKEMTAQFQNSISSRSHYKVLWNKNGRTFYVNNCIHLELEGEIFVRKAGYYIVSSQLNLRRQKEASTSMNETRPTTFSHHVDLLSHKFGTTGSLMQTKNSIARNSVFFTSFLSAVFKLNKNDRLSVSVSHPELLDINNPDDHFLVYYTYDQPN
ncbi:uncharacterized protein LOC128224581 isoform X2 [Mya arenaria]|uniref:uncharacterized protein LOC128224581 isoform X2 n=1 Tax=Mya arenaria TaxID=6604 RepID=UPI0022E594B8|nr:uncharacterized protein LOC128224581 isoform X2 [Mya arenaria]